MVYPWRTMPGSAPLPKWPTLTFERQVEGVVCGVDEAGCAPIAGPVVAAAVVLPAGAKPRRLRGLTDSKLLTAFQRERFFEIVLQIGEFGVGLATVDEIDRLNIFHADMLAMRRAVDALGCRPDHALVDGRARPPLDCDVTPLVKGDRRSLSIAAASVVAKVIRDQLMRELAQQHPAYGWQTNAGYGTEVHYLGLLRKGPTEHHRRSFAPVNTLFSPTGPGTGRYRFSSVPGRPDLHRAELLELRRDLHAVFDGDGHHLGVVKNLRGRWTFRAIGYDDHGEPVSGAGPCAACHGVRVASPQRHRVIETLTRNLVSPTDPGHAASN